jgi:uncharacterized repeat protein (TIGR03803 family)
MFHRYRCGVRLLALAAMALTTAVLAPSARAASFTPIYRFCQQVVCTQNLKEFCVRQNCVDGAHPTAGLIMDGNGILYGTTLDGGASGKGTVFKLLPPPAAGGAWTEQVIHSFCALPNCADGANPASGLLMDPSGDLYGTTINGGANGKGTVFVVTAGGVENVRYSFCSAANCADGANPVAGLITDGAGNLYGTTTAGGAGNQGTVFRVFGAEEDVLYSFCAQSGCTDGAEATAGLILDGTHNLYGTTKKGGLGQGTVFKLTPGPAGWTETVLYNFCSRAGCADGGGPEAGLFIDRSGTLYGTGILGGNQTPVPPSPLLSQVGTAFALNPANAYSVLYTFGTQQNCSDGAVPRGGLVGDAVGNFYGTTANGGTGACPSPSVPANLVPGGTVFELSSGGTETVLFNFGGTNGSGPAGFLLLGPAGNLYGTTREGGVSALGVQTGGGVVFQLSP